MQSLSLIGQLLALALLPVAGALHMVATIGMPIPLVLYSVMSVLTFRLYTDDKHRAQTNKQRIPEATLHRWEWVGGWPGAFLAQRTLRHKNRKQSYQAVFWAIVVLHLVFWVGWFAVRVF